MTTSNIHPTAIIDESAQLADDVIVGPYSVIGPNVTIGAGSHLNHHVTVAGNTKLGENTRIFQYASVGEMSQDFTDDGEDTWLEVGDNNTFREFVTINRGTAKDQGLTKIGNNNYFMAYSHVAHDCIIHNHCLLVNSTALGGHVVVHDHAIIGAGCAVHQFCHVGSHAFLARVAQVPSSVPPYMLVTGPGAELHGLNIVGLKRKGFSRETISALRRAYKVLYRQGLSLKDAVAELKEMAMETKEVNLLIEFIEQHSERGLLR